MVYFLLKVVLCAEDPSGSVVKTFHHTSLHMVILEEEVLVCVHGLSVDRDVQAAILSFSEQRVEKGECSVFFLLHRKFDGQPDLLKWRIFLLHSKFDGQPDLLKWRIFLLHSKFDGQLT